MKYGGRISLLFLSLLTSYIYLVKGNIASPLFLIFSLLHAAISWAFGRCYDKYKFLSYHDPLTGVFNRRYLNNVFEKKFQRTMKRNGELGILLIDINQFKMINDTYGHDCGDFVLMETCRLIQNSIHKEDILVRWGGDEFLVVFVNKDKTDVERVIGEINQRTEFVHSKCEKKKLYLSLSMGFSSFPEDANKLSELIAIADKRMYCFKNKAKL